MQILRQFFKNKKKKISPHDKKTRLQVLLLERSPISSKKEASNRMSTIREEERVPSLGWILQLVLAAREEGTKQSSPNLWRRRHGACTYSTHRRGPAWRCDPPGSTFFKLVRHDGVTTWRFFFKGIPELPNACCYYMCRYLVWLKMIVTLFHSISLLWFFSAILSFY